MAIGAILMAILTPTALWAMGAKPKHVSEIKGVSETQVARSVDGTKASILVRGKAAELIYKKIQEKRVEQIGTDALENIGALEATHWTTKGRQLVCSKIENKKAKREDYACALELDGRGEAFAKLEAFQPQVFNLARTDTKSKHFKKNKGRGLASAQPPAFARAKAYVMYNDPEKRLQSNDALIVIRGAAAKELNAFLAEQKGVDRVKIAGTPAIRAKDIGCVESNASEAERCALVISMSDGSISRSKNPILR
jgi:hypothetical protein